MSKILFFMVLFASVLGCTTPPSPKSETPHFSGEVIEPLNLSNPHRAVVIFSGFPSYYTRNADFAYVLAARMKIRTFNYDYKGLRQTPGAFSLIGSIENAQKAIEELKEKYKLKEVYVIGHSWGGTVALNVMRKHPDLVKKAFLMSPLLIADKKKSQGFKIMLKKTFLIQNQLKNQKVSPKDLAGEIPQLFEHYLPFRFAQEIKNPVTIIHSKKDRVIPFASSQAFAKLSGPHITVLDSGKTHWLSHNRPGIMRQAQAIFEK